MKTIIAATDFSSSAFNAACYATDMALAIKADVLLFHACPLPISYSEIPLAIQNRDISNAEANMRLLRDGLYARVDGRLSIQTEISLDGFFHGLETACARVRPYAVVMGCQGSTAAERLFFGSHAVHAMRDLQWALITVPAGVSFSKIRKIGLACDFDKVVDTIPVDEIERLITDFRAELHVLNVSRTKQFRPETVFESGLLQELMGDLKPEYHFIACENIDEGILEFVRLNRIDLLLIVPKKHSFLDKLMHHSHTKQLVLHSHLPVMAIHDAIL